MNYIKQIISMEFLANISNFSLIYDLLIYVPEGLQGALESTANIYLTSTKVSKTLHKKKPNFSAYVNLLCSFFVLVCLYWVLKAGKTYKIH